MSNTQPSPELSKLLKVGLHAGIGRIKSAQGLPAPFLIYEMHGKYTVVQVELREGKATVDMCCDLVMALSREVNSYGVVYEDALQVGKTRQTAIFVDGAARGMTEGICMALRYQPPGWFRKTKPLGEPVVVGTTKYLMWD